MFDKREFVSRLHLAGFKNDMRSFGMSTTDRAGNVYALLRALDKVPGTNKSAWGTNFIDFMDAYWSVSEIERAKYKSAIEYLEDEHPAFSTAAISSETAMVTVKYDKFGGTSSLSEFSRREKGELYKHLVLATQWSRRAVIKAMRTGLVTGQSQRVVRRWFGSSTTYAAPAIRHLKEMNRYLTNPAVTITFVDARRQSERILSVVEERVVPHTPVRREVWGVTQVAPMGPGDYAYVKPLRDHECEGIRNRRAHVGSGMRIYMGERGFHPSKTVVDGALTVYHEMTHKILGTKDWAYKRDPCRQLARSSGTRAKAFNCADSWAFFVQDLAACP